MVSAASNTEEIIFNLTTDANHAIIKPMYEPKDNHGSKAAIGDLVKVYTKTGMATGVVGVIVQGGLIRPLTKKYDVRKLMVLGIFLTAFGLGWIPYLEPSPFVIVLLAMSFIAAGNGLFQPTQSTLLTTEARGSSLDLGRVMGAQEGWGALSRIIGPIFAAFIWAETVEGTGLWSYHTVFRAAGLIAIMGILIQWKMVVTTVPDDEE